MIATSILKRKKGTIHERQMNIDRLYCSCPRPYNEKETFSTQGALYGLKPYHLKVSFCGVGYMVCDVEGRKSFI
jgi:hypothetical protein